MVVGALSPTLSCDGARSCEAPGAGCRICDGAVASPEDGANTFSRVGATGWRGSWMLPAESWAQAQSRVGGLAKRATETSQDRLARRPHSLEVIPEVAAADLGLLWPGPSPSCPDTRQGRWAEFAQSRHATNGRVFNRALSPATFVVVPRHCVDLRTAQIFHGDCILHEPTRPARSLPARPGRLSQWPTRKENQDPGEVAEQT